MHHKLFDRGVFTLSDKMKVIVSERANGTKGFQEWVIAFHGSSIRAPQRPNYFPDKVAVESHVSGVFQSPARCETPEAQS
jgi:putative restriction endonuclease